MMTFASVIGFAALIVAAPLATDRHELEVRAYPHAIKAHLTARDDAKLGVVLLSGSPAVTPWIDGGSMLLADFVVMGWGPMRNGELNLAVEFKPALPAGLELYAQDITVDTEGLQFGKVKSFQVQD